MNTSDSKYKAIAALEQFIREGHPVKFPVKGTSMLPFIVGDRDCVEFYPVEGELKVGDIVMARVEEGYPVVHRIIGIEPVELYKRIRCMRFFRVLYLNIANIKYLLMLIYGCLHHVKPQFWRRNKSPCLKIRISSRQKPYLVKLILL